MKFTSLGGPYVRAPGFGTAIHRFDNSGFGGCRGIWRRSRSPGCDRFIRNLTPVFEGFTRSVIKTSGAGIVAVVGGKGPPPKFWEMYDLVKVLEDWEALQAA